MSIRLDTNSHVGLGRLVVLCTVTTLLLVLVTLVTLDKCPIYFITTWQLATYVTAVLLQNGSAQHVSHLFYYNMAMSFICHIWFITEWHCQHVSHLFYFIMAMRYMSAIRFITDSLHTLSIFRFTARHSELQQIVHRGTCKQTVSILLVSS